MSKIVFFGIPGLGHVYPLTPILAELIRRGHDVTVFNSPEFESAIRLSGAAFVAYPPALTGEIYRSAVRTADFMILLEMLLRAAAPLLASALDRLEGDKPDLLMFDGMAVWGEIAANRLKVPSVSISASYIFDLSVGRRYPSEFWKTMRSMIRLLPQFNRDWAQLARFGRRNLPRRLPVLPRPGDLTVILASKDLHPRTPKFDDPSYAFVGPSIDAASRWEPFDFSRLDGRPLILVSLGSVFSANRSFFESAMAAFASLPAQVLLVVGEAAGELNSANAPENCIFVKSVPQLEVLPLTSVFVMHGGVGSVHEGLLNGVPIVAVPQMMEQFVTALAARDAGAAIVLEDDCFGGRITAAQLREAVDRILADDRYRERAKAMGEALRRTGGWKEAADRIEGLLAGGSPRR